MNSKTFRLVVVLAIVSISGILSIQIFWMGKAFDLSNKQFEHNVNMALLNVTAALCEVNQHEILPDPIEQLSSNYYVVNLNDKISPDLLEMILKREFEKREIIEDFEYGIFDCADEEMVYGKYINLNQSDPMNKSETRLPELNKDAYYFGVYFPNKPSNLVGEMWIWGFSTVILLIVVIFFGYTLFVIFKQKQFSEIQKDFINNMTHEFKTPISTIALSSDVLQSEEIIHQPDRLNKYAQVIKKEANRLQNQVDKVLQMATVEKNSLELSCQMIDVNKIIEEAVLTAELSLAASGGKIIFTERAKRSVVHADMVHITNLIYNLIDNAIKYNDNVPEVTLTTSNRDHNTFNISISDNGKGISKKNQQLIFKKFYRIPTGNIHDVKGFGLGLFYVKMLIEAHRGNIEVKSFDQGTTFMITLPMKNE